MQALGKGSTYGAQCRRTMTNYEKGKHIYIYLGEDKSMMGGTERHQAAEQMNLDHKDIKT